MNATEFKKMSDAQAIISAAPLFQKNAGETGILASVLLAQFIYESDSGKSELAQRSNNLFGMKACISGNTWEGSVWDGKSICIVTSEVDDAGDVCQIPQEFRAYGSIEDSICDHGMYLLHAKNGERFRYEGIAGEEDPFAAAKILQDGEYSTFACYSETLGKIIRYWGLRRFDKGMKDACIQ